MGSDEAVVFADTSMEAISSAPSRRPWVSPLSAAAVPSFDGSLWSRGILPIDSIAPLADARGEHLRLDTAATLDWDGLRRRVTTTGHSQFHVMAIAPTATISNIVGVPQSIEPAFRNLNVKGNMSGDERRPHARVHLVKRAAIDHGQHGPAQRLRPARAALRCADRQCDELHSGNPVRDEESARLSVAERACEP